MAVELCVTVAAVADKLVSGGVPPTAPVKVVIPLPPVIVSACAPFNVELKETFALFERMTLVPVKLTGLGKLNGLAPVTVVLAPTWIRLALVKERLVNALVPPTAPLNDIVPPVPARRVNAVAPLRVLEKLMFAPAAVPPALVVSIVGAPVIATGPVMVTIPPLVVMFPFTLIAVDPV